MPLGAGGDFGYTSPYWNPNQFNPDFGGSQWGGAMLEKDPRTAVYRYMRTIGAPIEDRTPFAQWLQNEYGNILTGYNAYTVSNPLQATIGGYLNTLPGLEGFQRRFNQQAPSLRGVNYAGAGAGPARWIGM
jgi:hypothetical protein